MSAKDDFFKKVTENKERQEATKVQIASDTLRFTNAMHHLIQQIEVWLHNVLAPLFPDRGCILS